MNQTYAIIARPNPQELADAVGAMMTDGWKPQGGLAIIAILQTQPSGRTEQSAVYHQALVKESQDAEPK